MDSIEAASGMLSFIAPPEYSNPQDKNGDNIYRVQVLSADGISTDTQTIRVEVTSDSAAMVPIINYLLF
jgi:serralysin